MGLIASRGRNVSETIEHFLLQCPCFHSHRVVPCSQLLTLNVATCDLPTLLVAAGVHPSRQHAVIHLTCAFLRKTGQLHGVDIVPLMEMLGAGEKILSHLQSSNAGYYAIAYAMYKIATPARYTVTVEVMMEFAESSTLLLRLNAECRRIKSRLFTPFLAKAKDKLDNLGSPRSLLRVSLGQSVKISIPNGPIQRLLIAQKSRVVSTSQPGQVNSVPTGKGGLTKVDVWGPCKQPSVVLEKKYNGIRTEDKAWTRNATNGATQPMEQRNQWSNATNGTTQPVEQRNQWSNATNGTTQPVEQRNQWSNATSGATQPVE
ncbi:hypothetical protein GWK47_022402 [Chionoecetes opilio]|uniref:DUF1279 domain-containing protein n=1 Tax=Chionoecetes opilio TaxID=41210 RepID=A0A8J4XN21_CHIOP|nr:hypothetical protein GWK47_022402 [Chionoecetes opilio]